MPGTVGGGAGTSGGSGGGTASGVGPGVAAGGACAQQRSDPPPQGWTEVESHNQPEAVVDRGDEIKHGEQRRRGEVAPGVVRRVLGADEHDARRGGGFCYDQGGMIVCP
mmetsp:Transcript_13203/g.30353  ORF Transcript_13203/g.30353 Transcript_13203/m.30353 type:complete len:109 (+) Transcript_13203:320-646(+)